MAKSLIIDANGKETSEAGAISAYFGRHPGQTLSEFMKEVKELSAEAKTEIALGAAKAMGWTVRDAA